MLDLVIRWNKTITCKFLAVSSMMEILSWEPVRVWVVILALGMNEWQTPYLRSRMDLRLIEAFEMWGVPPNQIRWIGDKFGTAEEIKNQLPVFLKQTSPNDLLIFYYAGHGQLDSNAHYTAFEFVHPKNRNGLVLGELLYIIDAGFNGKEILFMADCCFSGALADAARNWQTTKACAALTSTTAEKPSTSNWTFTDCLYQALMGKKLNKMDADKNTIITLKELAEYVRGVMWEKEKQVIDFGTNARFNTAMAVNKIHAAKESQTAAGHKRADDDEMSEEDEMNIKEKQVGVLQECVSEAEWNKYNRTPKVENKK
jgi:hypothetical protein